MGDKQAFCPNCNKAIRWDWEQDIFLIENEDCISTKLFFDRGFVGEVFRCSCGQIIGAVDNGSGDIASIKELKDIDWDLPINTILDIDER